MDGVVVGADLNAMSSSLSGPAWKAMMQAPATPHNTRRNVCTTAPDVSACKIKPPKRASDSLPRLLLVYASTGPLSIPPPLPSCCGRRRRGGAALLLCVRFKFSVLIWGAKGCMWGAT